MSRRSCTIFCRASAGRTSRFTRSSSRSAMRSVADRRKVEEAAREADRAVRGARAARRKIARSPLRCDARDIDVAVARASVAPGRRRSSSVASKLSSAATRSLRRINARSRGKPRTKRRSAKLTKHASERSRPNNKRSRSGPKPMHRTWPRAAAAREAENRALAEQRAAEAQAHREIGSLIRLSTDAVRMRQHTKGGSVSPGRRGSVADRPGASGLPGAKPAAAR